jgi:O-antigen/teichoic acid export membrane protein
VIARRGCPWLRLGFGEARRETVRELLSPALAVMVIPLAQSAYLQGTAVVVGVAGSPSMVPIYTALRTLSRVGVQLISSLSIPIMPEYAAAKARGEEAKASRLAAALTLAVVTVGLLAALVLTFGGETILHLWTRGAIRAPQAMIDFFAAAIFLHIIWAPLSDLLLAINRHHTYSYAYLGLAVASGALTYLLVRAMGVTGAAVGNLALEVAMMATVLASLRRWQAFRGFWSAVASLPWKRVAK